jgi:hypothetical protein
MLPEEPADMTQPNRNPHSHNPANNQPPPNMYGPGGAQAPHGPGSTARSGLASTVVFGAPMPELPQAGDAQQQAQGQWQQPQQQAYGGAQQPASIPPTYEEERIDIPGTHVPAWVVVALVVCVMALLAILFMFLR